MIFAQDLPIAIVSFSPGPAPVELGAGSRVCAGYGLADVRWRAGAVCAGAPLGRCARSKRGCCRSAAESGAAARTREHRFITGAGVRQDSSLGFDALGDLQGGTPSMGLVGRHLAVSCYCGWRSWLLDLLVLAVPSVALGQQRSAAGAISHSRPLGRPHTLPWKLRFRPFNRPAPFIDRLSSTLSTESFWNLGVSGPVADSFPWVSAARSRLPNGALSCTY